ncbi:uncharacterized protein Sara isoform X2 [Planococcus citri]|uniref:uncharacterized protein Sara isoform X2 n=1 Tax=Planococcus citri TaxID=170843 RepID=UPI0031F8B5AD
MEKYAIDLEKVLDEFEYREKQSHTFSGEQRSLNDSYGSNYSINDSIFPRHYKPPASNYRRPPFEPMNLADADFSVTAKPSSCLQTEVTVEGCDNPPIVPPPISSTSSLKDDDFRATEAAAAKYDYELNLDNHAGDYSYPSYDTSVKDYAPDLIESNRDLCSNLNKFGLVERHLPDVATANVASTDDESERTIDGNFDTIASCIDKPILVDDPAPLHEPVLLPAIAVPEPVAIAVESHTLKKASEKVISFQISDDVSDHALKQYLDELVETENLDCRNEFTTNTATNTSSDVSTHNDDLAEENTEITEDCSYSTTADIDDKVGEGNDTECSSSENFGDRKSSNSSENDNRDYHLLSDNMLLISSSVDSQENADSDSGGHNDNEFNENETERETSPANRVDEESISVHHEPSSSYHQKNDSVTDLNARVSELEIVGEVEEIKHRTVVQIAGPRVVHNELPEVECAYASRPSRERHNVAEIPTTSSSTQIEYQEKKSSSCAQIDTKTDEPDSNSAADTASSSNDNTIDDVTSIMLPPPSTSAADNRSLVSRGDEENSKLSSNLGIETLDSRTAILNFDSRHHHQIRETPPSPLQPQQPNLHLAPGTPSQDSERLDQNAQFANPSCTNYDPRIEDGSVVDDDSLAKPQRPDSLNLLYTTQSNDMSSTSADSGSLLSVEDRKLGKEAPYWVPDSDSTVCMLCQLKFNPVIRRRHHCRACGMVVCAKCSDKKACLEYLGFKEDRVCHTCHSILQKVNNTESELASAAKRPNPNNPMEYCSTIPPLLQVGSTHHPPPSVLVPKVGVLKREGRPKTNDMPKQVIFSDGIRPGGDLTELDVTSEPKLPLRRSSRITKRVGTPPGKYRYRRLLNPDTRSFIPSGADLPPLVNRVQGECIFSELEKPVTTETEPIKFAINRNLFVAVKRLILDCCVHKEVWCITTEGMSCVGQDELVFILEVTVDEKHPPKDIFSTINVLYQEASKGSTVTEMSFAEPCNNQLFGCKEHGGFIFIRPTYQCVQKLLLPKPPFLLGLLIHRWETPWARLFPIRLVLRLGAEYRYYPCPLVSVRNRPALYSEIGHTIFTLLADFRKYTYTLPTVRGLMIHMEDRLTTIVLPRNRYDQVIRALNNSEENVLAFAGNISTVADSHLVCIQSIQQEDTTYHTQAINIVNKPREVTGASFIVFNGSLKQYGWSGKSNIVEDGLMVQIPSESMTALRSALRQMKDYSIGCGPQAEEMVTLKWESDDVNFNLGVKSEIDNQALDGVPSIRVHNGIDYSGTLRLIRWTEVFILRSEDESSNRTGESINISKLAESVAKATCIALVPLLDLLATANLTTLAVRATIHPENVGYEAGSRGEKLPPIYMKSLDEELIAVIHEAAVSIPEVLNPIVLELIFKIMEQG